MSNGTTCHECGSRIEGLGMMQEEAECWNCGATTDVIPVGGSP